MKTTIYILFIVFFIACVHGSSKKTENRDAEETLNEFIGKWESLKRMYPYTSYLSIENDSTFHFEYGACMSGGFSKGTWKMRDSTIVLTSDEIDSCMYLSYFEDDCIPVPDENDTCIYIAEKTKPDCKPRDETDYVMFYHEEFYIDNDTLKHIVKKPKLCPEIRNDFIRIVSDTTANSR